MDEINFLIKMIKIAYRTFARQFRAPPRVAFNFNGIDEETHMKVIKPDLLFMNDLPVEEEQVYKF